MTRAGSPTASALPVKPTGSRARPACARRAGSRVVVDGRVVVERDARVPRVLGGLVEAHPGVRGERQRRREEAELRPAGRRAARGSAPRTPPRARRRRHEGVGLLARRHRVPAVPDRLVEAVTGRLARTGRGAQRGQADLGAAAEVREHLGDRPLGGTGGREQLLVVRPRTTAASSSWVERRAEIVASAVGVMGSQPRCAPGVPRDGRRPTAGRGTVGRRGRAGGAASCA